MRVSDHRYYPYLVCFVVGMFIFYKYLLQISPSIISHELMRDFHLTGAMLGNLTACFLYSYFIMQIPAGIILDKHNPKVVVVTTIMFTAVFTLLFALSNSVLSAGLARAGIGLAVAFALNAYLKVVTLWSSPKHFALMAGFSLTIAMAGAMGGQVPLALLVTTFGWREALGLIGVLGFVLAFFCWRVMRSEPPNEISKNIKEENRSYRQFFSGLGVILKNKQNWFLGLYCGLAFGPVSAFGGLWGVPFLQEAYHLTKIEAASNISMIYLGIAVGCPLLGWISDYLQKRLLIMMVGTFIGLLSIGGVIYGSQLLSSWMLTALLFLFGFWISSLMLCFVVALEIQTTIFAASLIAFINTIPSIFEAITEPLIGKLLDLGWNGMIVDGSRAFAKSDYCISLSVLPIYLVLAMILLFFIKENPVPLRKVDGSL